MVNPASFDTRLLLSDVQREAQYLLGVYGLLGKFDLASGLSFSLFADRKKATHVGSLLTLTYKPVVSLPRVAHEHPSLDVLVEALGYLYDGQSAVKRWKAVLESKSLPREVRFTGAIVIEGVSRIHGKSPSFSRMGDREPVRGPKLKNDRWRVDMQQPFRYPEFALESWQNFTESVLNRSHATRGGSLRLVRVYLYCWRPTPEYLREVRAEMTDKEYNRRGYWNRK